MPTYVICNDSADTWQTWNCSTTPSITVSNSSTDWAVWSGDWANATSQSIWVKWIGNDITSDADLWNNTGVGHAWDHWNVQWVDEAPARENARERRHRVRREQRAQETAKRAQDAMSRAEQLLAACLSAQEREEIEKHRYLTVEGGRSKRRYRVHTNRGHHGNIEEVNEQGQVLRSFCVAPSGDMPHADRLLGQKLFIEHDEDEFLRRANVTERRVG